MSKQVNSLKNAMRFMRDSIKSVFKSSDDADLAQPDAYAADDSGSEFESPDLMASGTIKFGLVLFIFIFGFVGVWAATAPLSSAAVAMGKVVLNQNKKTIQHLEGGIVAEIFVQEGDKVEAGDPLVRLSDINAKAKLDILRMQVNTARAAEARLLAIRDGKQTPDFHRDLIAQSKDEDMRDLLQAQTRLFASQQLAFQGQLDVMSQRVKQLEDEIKGLQSRKRASERQLQLIEDEIGSVRELVNRGLAQKPRLLSLQRDKAELEGSIGEFTSLIAKSGQSIGENKIQMINLRTERINEVMEELSTTQDTIADVEERLRAARDVMNRIIVMAPQSGTVTGLMVHTIGGVISPGDPIMDIVPQDDELIIEARVLPTDIDIVYAGLDARVRLSAFKVREVPMLNGKVKHVSADSFIDKSSGEQFYTARIKVNDGELDALEGVELYPGMPADVLVVTGAKTPLQYLLDPLSSYALKAMREQ